MALISVSRMNYTTGAVPSLTAAAATDTFDAPREQGSRFIVYKNTNASTRTVTVNLPAADKDQYGRALTDIANTLGATTGELWIPVHPAMADASNIITVDVSATTDVTVGYIEILPA
jgi:glycine cleavage system regulatory protein